MKFLALLLLVALPALGQDEPPPEGFGTRDITRICNDQGMCLISRDDYDFLRDGNRMMAKKLREYEKPPECAKTEVTEPSKNAPKKLPPIKRENDT